MWVEGLRAEGGNAWRQENELDWYRLNEPIFSESMKVMTQWKCFDKSHYAKPEPVWLQRGLPQSMIISLRESIPGRRKQSHFFFSFLPSDYCLLFSKVRPLVPQLQRLIFKNDSPFLFFSSQNAYTLRVNEALYQQSTSSICIYDTDGHFIHALKTTATALWFHSIRDAFMY